MSELIHVEHDTQNECFSAVVDGYQALLEYRTLDADSIDIYHTFVPDELRGKGVAAVLAKEALAYAKQKDLKVVPSCSYLAAYLERHPQ